jgi:hypothetical protein
MGLHSSLVDVPLKNSGLVSVVHERFERHILSLYHFRKQLSYFLEMSVAANQMNSTPLTYSFTSLHSGAKDADMMMDEDGARRTDASEGRADLQLLSITTPRP